MNVRFCEHSGACLVTKGIDENCFGCFYDYTDRKQILLWLSLCPDSSAEYFIHILFPWHDHVCYERIWTIYSEILMHVNTKGTKPQILSLPWPE